MKVVPLAARQAWKSPIAANSAVVVFSLANGMVSADDDPLPFLPRWGSSDLGDLPGGQVADRAAGGPAAEAPRSGARTRSVNAAYLYRPLRPALQLSPASRSRLSVVRPDGPGSEGSPGQRMTSSEQW